MTLLAEHFSFELAVPLVVSFTGPVIWSVILRRRSGRLTSGADVVLAVLCLYVTSTILYEDHSRYFNEPMRDISPLYGFEFLCRALVGAGIMIFVCLRTEKRLTDVHCNDKNFLRHAFCWFVGSWICAILYFWSAFVVYATDIF